MTSDETIREARAWVADALDEEIHYASPVIDRVVETLAERGLLRPEMTEERRPRIGHPSHVQDRRYVTEWEEVPDGEHTNV